MDTRSQQPKTSARRTGAPIIRRFAARMLSVLLLATAACAPALAQDEAAIVSADTAPVLAPGEYSWTPEASPQGDVVLVVSLPEQRVHVYRGGVRIGVSTISSGRAGKDTPTGVFPILGKERMHHSNLYNSAPMPYMQRLTWDGIALHAGHVPGYPASHGCIRLPAEFAEKLFGVTASGTLVVVADDASYDASVVSPGPMVPVDARTGLALDAMRAMPLDNAPLDDAPIAQAQALGADVATTTAVPTVIDTTQVAPAATAESVATAL